MQAVATPQLFREVFLPPITPDALVEKYVSQAEKTESLLLPLRLCISFAQAEKVRENVVRLSTPPSVLLLWRFLVSFCR